MNKPEFKIDDLVTAVNPKESILGTGTYRVRDFYRVYGAAHLELEGVFNLLFHPRQLKISYVQEFNKYLEELK